MILLYTGMYVIVFYSREKKCLRCCGCVELLLQCCVVVVLIVVVVVVVVL